LLLRVVPPPMTMAPTTPPFADDVLNSYMHHVVRAFHPKPAVHEQMETAIRNYYVMNLQRENTSEGTIYELLSEMNPHLGNPLTFYEEFVMKYDDSYKKGAAKAQKKAEKKQKHWLHGPCWS
jgi:hypothetical protein